MILAKQYFNITFMTICLFCCVNYASSLGGEAILGGIAATPATKYDYDYLVSIVGKENRSLEHTLLGSGIIVSNHFVLSTANIFLLPSGELKERRFSVVVGAQNLSSPNVAKIDMLCIYLPVFDKSFLYYNLALVTLVAGVGLGENPNVSSLRLAHPAPFYSPWAVVSGFGYFEVEIEMHEQTGQPFVARGNLSSILRYRSVTILSDEDCAKWYPKEVTLTNLCGTMTSRDPDQVVGVCTGDHGSPLVVGNMVVGLVSFITPDCDNRFIGALYIRVSHFRNSLENFMRGIVPEDSFMRFNRPYLAP